MEREQLLQYSTTEQTGETRETVDLIKNQETSSSIDLDEENFNAPEELKVGDKVLKANKNDLEAIDATVYKLAEISSGSATILSPDGKSHKISPNKLIKAEMGREEFLSWNKVDIKGYMAKITTIVGRAQLTADFLNSNKQEEANKSLTKLKEVCQSLSNRINQIDISQLDNRLPLELITDLTENGPKILENIVKSIDDILENSTIENKQANRYLKIVETEMNYFRNLGNKIARTRYLLYRTLAEETERN